MVSKSLHHFLNDYLKVAEFLICPAQPCCQAYCFSLVAKLVSTCFPFFVSQHHHRFHIMLEIPEQICLEINKFPLEPVVGELRRSLQDVFKPKSSDSPKTEKLSSDEGTDDDSSQNDSSRHIDLSKAERFNEGPFKARRNILTADLNRFQRSRFIPHYITCRDIVLRSSFDCPPPK